MPKPDSLHELILSLDKSEKRYFKIHASSSSNRSESSYIEMFDILVKQKVYDEDTLIKKIGSESFSKNLSQNKKYLKDLIIRSLCEKEGKTPTDSVNQLLKEFGILDSKLLFSEMYKKLQKAKAISEKYELFQLNIDVLNLEMKRMFTTDYNKSLETIEDCLQNLKHLNYKNTLINDLNRSKFFVYNLMLKHNKKISNLQVDLIENEIAQYDKAEILKHNSFELSQVYLQILEFYYSLKNDFENNVAVAKQMFNLYNYRFEHFKSIDNRYTYSYTNYVSALFRAGKFETLYEVLCNADNIQLKNENEKLYFLIKTTSNWLSYYLNTGKIDEAYLLELKFEETYQKKKSKISKVDLISIFYNFSLIYFFNEKFEKCLFWLQRLEYLKEEQRKDIFTDAYIIAIICNYELNNHSILESLVRSKRSRKGILEIEDLITNSILKSSKNDLKKKLVFENLEKELQKHLVNHLTVDWTTLKIWLNSKIKNQSIQELYRKEVL